VVSQLFLQFGDAGFDFLAVGAVFVHFHFRKRAFRILRRMPGDFIHFLLGQMQRVSTSLNHSHDSVADGGEFSGLQFANLICHEAAVRGEKFAGAHITGQAE
jgi:galactokinase